MNSILFVLDEIKTEDQNEIKLWQNAIDSIEGICTFTYKKGVCPESLLLIREKNGLPLLARAISFVEKLDLSYKLIFIEKASEWNHPKIHKPKNLPPSFDFYHYKIPFRTRF